MERTELREAFFDLALRDPYTHMIFHHVTEAWAYGYEQALRDHGLTDARLRETFGDRRKRAEEWMTDAQRASEAKAIVALAQIGNLLSPLSATERETSHS